MLFNKQSSDVKRRQSFNMREVLMQGSKTKEGFVHYSETEFLTSNAGVAC